MNQLFFKTNRVPIQAEYDCVDQNAKLDELVEDGTHGYSKTESINQAVFSSSSTPVERRKVFRGKGIYLVLVVGFEVFDQVLNFEFFFDFFRCKYFDFFSCLRKTALLLLSYCHRTLEIVCYLQRLTCF